MQRTTGELEVLLKRFRRALWLRTAVRTLTMGMWATAVVMAVFAATRLAGVPVGHDAPWLSVAPLAVATAALLLRRPGWMAAAAVCDHWCQQNELFVSALDQLQRGSVERRGGAALVVARAQQVATRHSRASPVRRQSLRLRGLAAATGTALLALWSFALPVPSVVTAPSQTRSTAPAPIAFEPKAGPSRLHAEIAAARDAQVPESSTTEEARLVRNSRRDPDRGVVPQAGGPQPPETAASPMDQEPLPVLEQDPIPEDHAGSSDEIPMAAGVGRAAGNTAASPLGPSSPTNDPVPIHMVPLRAAAKPRAPVGAESDDTGRVAGAHVAEAPDSVSGAAPPAVPPATSVSTAILSPHVRAYVGRYFDTERKLHGRAR